MKRTLLVVNGEHYWGDYLGNRFNTYRTTIAEMQVSMDMGELRVETPDAIIYPAVILWRVGAIIPTPKDKLVMDAIHRSGVRCYNSIETLRMGYDRLDMLEVMKSLGMPVIPYTIAKSCGRLSNFHYPEFPCVLKRGNLHGGKGKSLITDPHGWDEAVSLLWGIPDYCTVEPYIKYDRDIRYLLIGGSHWVMERKSSGWKVQSGLSETRLIEPDPVLLEMCERLKSYIKADIIGVDIIQKDGISYILEYNDIPGLSGFPEACKIALADLIE